MAELLIRTVDKVNPNNKQKNAKCPKRGMVVTIQADGWPWTQKERDAPFWEIRKYPGVPVDALSGFLAPEAGDPLVDPYLQRRQFTFNLAEIIKENATTVDVLKAQVLRVPWTDKE